MSVVVLGGCGHVGLPLAISLAGVGVPTVAYDINADSVAMVNAGRMPFREGGPAEELLQRTLGEGSFAATTDPGRRVP